MKLGLGLGARASGIGTGPTAPSAFTVGQWTLADSPSVGGNELTLNITALPSDNGSAFTSFEYRRNGGAATFLAGVGTGARTITVLATTAADIQIRANNSVGNGPWSDTKTETPSISATVPGTFGTSDWSVVDAATSGDITINIINLPSDGGSAITALQYQINAGSWVSLGGTTTGSYGVSGLTDGVSVTVAVRAVNAIGNGTASATKSVTPTAAGPVAPIVDVPGSIDAQPLIGQVIELTEPEMTGVTSIAYQWYRGAPTTTAISGATSADYTPVDADYNLTLYRRATYTNATGDTIEDLEAPAVVGRVFTEDWAGYTVGNTKTQLLTLYDEVTGTGLTNLVITDASAPAGKSTTFTCTTSASRGLWKTDAQVFGTAQAAVTTRMQALYVFRHRGINGNHRYELKTVNDTLNGRRNSGIMLNAGIARLQVESEGSSATVGTQMKNPLVAGTVYCVRLEFTPTTIGAKMWEYGSPETVSFTTRSDTYTNSPPAPFMGVRFTSASPEDMFDMLWWSAGYNADAPFWTGFVEPAPSTSDLMTFAAPSSVTSATYANSSMVINLEDV